MVTMRRKPEAPDIIEADAIEGLSDRIDAVEGRVEAIEGAFPDKDYKAHNLCHTDDAVKKARQEETKKHWHKLKTDLFFDIAKTVAKGLVFGAFSIFMLGVYTKFNEAVNKAVDIPKAAAGSDK